jgi:NitT/TauT family transport system substrate-binding protein
LQAIVLGRSINRGLALEKRRPMTKNPDHHENHGRRRVVIARVRAVGAASVMLLTAMTGVGHCAEKLSIRLDWITEPMHLPFFLADERGWLKAAGLDVTIEDGNGSTMTVQLVGAGRFDIGLADLSPMAIGRARGLPVISIAGFIRRGGVGFVVPKSTRIASLSDFIGKEIFYTTSSFEGPFVEPLFRSNGVPFERIKLVNMEASAKIPAYLSGRGDAMITTVPPNLVIAAGKRDSYGVLFADHGFNLPSFGLVARSDTLKTRAVAVRRFASVIASAWTYILASPEHAVEAARITLKHRPSSPLPMQVMVAQTESYRPYFYTNATADKPIGLQADADWEVAIRNMEAAKVIAPGSRPADYYTNDMIDLDYGRKIVDLP